jgi:hypothetical protein
VALAIASLALLVRFELGTRTPSSIGPPAPPSNSSRFNVTVLVVHYTPTACLSNATGPGVRVHGEDTFDQSIVLTNPGTTQCEVNQATAVTRGFTILQTNTPFLVGPQSSHLVNLTIQAPDFDVDQAIEIAISVTVL